MAALPGCENQPDAETVPSAAASSDPTADAPLTSAPIRASHPPSLAVGAWPSANSDCPIRKCKPRPRREYAPDIAEPPFEEVLAEQLNAEQDKAYFEPRFAQARQTALPISRALLAADPHHEVGRALAFPPFERLFSRRQSFASNPTRYASARRWVEEVTRSGFSTFSQRNHTLVVPAAMDTTEALFFAWPSSYGAVVLEQLGGHRTLILPRSSDDCEETAEGLRGRALLATWDALALVDDICSPPSGFFRSEAGRDTAGVSFRGRLWSSFPWYVSAFAQGDRVILDLQYLNPADGSDDPYRGPPQPSDRAKHRWSQ